MERVPVALIGSLEGTGTFTLENARVARLDPKAFEMVVRAVDQGVAIDADRLARRERTRRSRVARCRLGGRKRNHHRRRSSALDQFDGRRTRC